MPRIRKRTVDEHENMEPTFSKKKNYLSLILLILFIITVFIYLKINITKKERENKKIEEMVSSIKNEIFIKQCMLDKIYCCHYKNNESCKKWLDANCLEKDNSSKINCEMTY